MDATVWIGLALFVLIVVVPMVTLLVRHERTIRAIATARTTYQAALADLHAHPNNSTLRIQALTAGQAYARLTQQQRDGAGYSDQMVLQDITMALLDPHDAPNEPQRAEDY